MKPFNWLCPYCGHRSTITDPDYQESSDFWKFTPKASKSTFGYLIGIGIRCPNEECEQVQMTVAYTCLKPTNAGSIPDWDAVIKQTQILPESSAKPQPAFIPEVIREDYYEACRIRTLSPKASATLARRCLQGVIRDYWQITKSRLIDEIAELKGVVDGDLWSAIDGVRSIGNIGAHMEKDVNIIVDVDEDEAQLLIELLELLFKETYVRREDRRQRTTAVATLAASKQQQKNSSKKT